MNDEIIGKIIERDCILGKLCLEAQNSYNQQNYFSALACLFVTIEQVVKFIVESQFVNFEEENLKKVEKYWALWKYINYAREKNLITEDENQMINFIIDCRNKIFHANLYPSGLKIKDKFWSFSEDETKELIYKEFSTKVFQLVFKLVKN